MKENLDILVADLGPGNLAGNVVAMANAGRFDSAFYNEPDTNYTVGGWDRDPLVELLEFYAPAYSTPDRFHYKAATHADFFQRFEGDQDIRPMGGQFGKLDVGKMTDVNETLDEKGIVIPVDKREVDEDPMALEKAMDRGRRILLRTELRRALALLSAAATNAAKTWDTTAGKDPDQDVATDLLTAENASGVRPNRVGYGSTAWSKRQLAFRAQNNAGGYASAAWTPQQVGDFLNVQALGLTEARYRSGASALTAMVANLVFMFFAESGGHKDDPSNIKRFVGNINGQSAAVFRQEFPRHWEVTVAHKSKTKITSTLAIRKQTIS